MNIERRDLFRLIGGGAAFAIVSGVSSRLFPLMSFAADGSENVTMTRCAYDDHLYGGNSLYTLYFSSDGENLRRAWCSTPGAKSGALQGVDSGKTWSVFSAQPLTESILDNRPACWGGVSFGTYASPFSLKQVRAVMWCAPGNPGYDEDMWSEVKKRLVGTHGNFANHNPKEWTLGAWQEHIMHYICTMCMAGYQHAGQGEYYTPWPYEHGQSHGAIGYDPGVVGPILADIAYGGKSGTLPKAGSIMAQMIAKADEVPDEFEVFVINPNGTSYKRDGENVQVWLTSKKAPDFADLTIQKVTTGTGSDKDHKFTFHVVIKSAGKTLTDERIKLDGNKNNSKSYKKLPAGSTYSVKEELTDDEKLRYKPTLDGKSSGSLSAGSSVTLKATNTSRTYSLSVKKVVSTGSTDQKFDFTCVIKNGNTTWKTVKFSIKAGEMHTIDDIPYGYTYKVTESLPDKSWKVSWKNDEGTITKNMTATASNEQAGYLKVQKDSVD